MNIIDKVYREWAWRSESGTPDINNPADRKILEEIIGGPVQPKQVVVEEEEEKPVSKDDIISYIQNAELDDKQLKKLLGVVQSFTNYRSIRRVVRNKGYKREMSKPFSKALTAALEDLPDQDNKKLISYLDDPSKHATFPADTHTGNLYAVTGKSGLPNNVTTALINHTGQDEKKLGIGRGELALALLFQNIQNAEGKGDLRLNGKEYEVKGHNGQFGDYLPMSGKVYPRLGPKFEKTIKQTGQATGGVGSFPQAISKHYKNNPEDREEFTSNLKNLLMNIYGEEPVKYLSKYIDYNNGKSLQDAIALMNFMRYAIEQGFDYLMVHDFGSRGKNKGNYIHVSGSPQTMADSLKKFLDQGLITFQGVDHGKMGPRISIT